MRVVLPLSRRLMVDTSCGRRDGGPHTQPLHSLQCIKYSRFILVSFNILLEVLFKYLENQQHPLNCSYARIASTEINNSL